MPALAIFCLVIIGFAILLTLGPILYFLGQAAFTFFIFFLFFKLVVFFSKIF
jgi:hypothetical protein